MWELFKKLRHQVPRPDFRSVFPSNFAKLAQLINYRGPLEEIRAELDKINLQEQISQNLLHIAIEARNPRALEEILSRGLDPNHKYHTAGATNPTPALIAATNGSHELLRMLFLAGANPNLASNMGENPNDKNLVPLHQAARNGHDVAVGVLLQRGAIVDLETASRQTPLGLACTSHAPRSPVVVRLLLAHGADPYAGTPPAIDAIRKNPLLQNVYDPYDTPRPTWCR